MDYLSAATDYNLLSLRDLLEARDLYHAQLIHKPNVLATAIGRYRIRKTDPWPHTQQAAAAASPEATQAAQRTRKAPRTLENSEVRPYSWPSLLVFVDQWVAEDQFGSGSGKVHPQGLVPDALYMPDGRVVPVCVIAAPQQEVLSDTVGDVVFPESWIGGGYPVVVEVQGEEHVASIGCLVTDGHLTYALTNRHVSGAAGEAVSTLLKGQRVGIGQSSAKQLTRLPFSAIYAEWPGKEVYLALDVGLIELADKRDWTAQVYGIGQLGELADLSEQNMSLRLIDCPVRAYGCSSHAMVGSIAALFYRYKSVGGFEYVADFLIGPRGDAPFGTRPGDSGTLWLLDTGDPHSLPRPIAIQWGGHVTIDGGTKKTQSYALATSLSPVCNLLEVDIVRDWNIGITDYWGAVGHYTIANQACGFVANQKLRTLMQANMTNITFATGDISIQNLSGLSRQPFVPLADVPDLVWKIGHYNRGAPEHPNHFADMDKPRQDGVTLLELCKGHPENVSIPVWQEYYTAVGDQSRGLLPFRTWQFYQGMVDFVQQGDVASFICAAGILAHYVGDACQPLHISYMFNGDPENPDPATGKPPRGQGVHSAYEDDMVNDHTLDILQGVTQALSTMQPLDRIQGGQQAAVAVVDLMQQTFATISPGDIVNAFVQLEGSPRHQIADGLWSQFGAATIQVITEGSRHLAMIWDSAWAEGNGDATIGELSAIDQDTLASKYQDRSFMPSHTLDTIGPLLEGAPAAAAAAPGT